MRQTYPNQIFDGDVFLEKVKGNRIIIELQEKFLKTGDGVGSRNQDIINRLTPMYENIFKELFGGEVVKTYAELNDEVKIINEKLKKDKTLTKLTGNQRTYLIERIIQDRLSKKIDIIFTCVVHPKEASPYSWNRNEKVKPVFIPSGILDYKIGYLGTFTRGLHTENDYGFTGPKDIKFKLRHNYGGYFSYGKKYTTIDGYDRDAQTTLTYDVDLYVNITKSEIDAIDHRKQPK